MWALRGTLRYVHCIISFMLCTAMCAGTLWKGNELIEGVLEVLDLLRALVRCQGWLGAEGDSPSGMVNRGTAQHFMSTCIAADCLHYC